MRFNNFLVGLVVSMFECRSRIPGLDFRVGRVNFTLDNRFLITGFSNYVVFLLIIFFRNAEFRTHQRIRKSKRTKINSV